MAYVQAILETLDRKPPFDLRLVPVKDDRNGLREGLRGKRPDRDGLALRRDQARRDSDDNARLEEQVRRTARAAEEARIVLKALSVPVEVAEGT